MYPDVRVKICGITRLEDATLAQALGAWAIGFIFYEKSPRFVLPEGARQILDSKNPNITAVGVFVNAGLDTIFDTVNRSQVNAVQLHGDESPEFCLKIRERLPGHLLIKAFRPRNRSDLKQILGYSMCDHLLLDHYDETERGGTGKTGDWELALEAVKLGSVILAGGLNAGNVKAAMIKVAPYAVDVSSLLETSPGIKNENKMREFFLAVKS